MNTVILKGASFYEFEEVQEVFEEIKSTDIVGFLFEWDRIDLSEVQNNENYIITIVKEDNGEHTVFYVNGLELKINYSCYDEMSHGGLNIWNVNDLKENLVY